MRRKLVKGHIANIYPILYKHTYLNIESLGTGGKQEWMNYVDIIELWLETSNGVRKATKYL
jgi:hypothetical protein